MKERERGEAGWARVSSETLGDILLLSGPCVRGPGLRHAELASSHLEGRGGEPLAALSWASGCYTTQYAANVFI